MMMVMGPVLERLNDECSTHRQAHLRHHGTCWPLPVPPRNCRTSPSSWNTISIMAQAMKLNGVVSVEPLRELRRWRG